MLIDHIIKSGRRYLCITPLIILFVIINSASGMDFGYDDIEIKDNKFIYRVWSSNEQRVLDLSDFELSKDAIKIRPLNVFTYNENSFKISLLKLGLAKLKNETSASLEAKTAQNHAKEKGLGLWKPVLLQDIKPQTPVNEVIDWPKMRNKIAIFISLYGGYAAALTTLIAVIKILSIYLRKRKLYLIFLGARSAGKTALYQRMFNPSKRPDGCDKPEATLKTVKTVSREQLHWGRFIVTPEYIDIGGNLKGQVANILLKNDFWLQRLLRPNRRIWIIVLSTTDLNAKRDDPQKMKIDERFIIEQNSDLSLPIGLLLAKKPPLSLYSLYFPPKPDMVFICITKFDLFSEHEPNDPLAKQQMADIHSLLQKPILRIEEACKGITHCDLVYCSACEGWNIHVLRESIETTLYRK